MSERRKFSDYEKRTIYDTYKGKCFICGEKVNKNKMTISHKKPLSKGGTNAIDNLLLVCWNCGQAKQNLEMGEFLDMIYKIYCYNKEKLNKD